MKSLTIRLPDGLARRIEQESLTRRVSKSDIVRERLTALPPARRDHPLADLLAEMDRLPATGRKRNAARDQKRLPEIIRAHYRAAKRHSCPACCHKLEKRSSTTDRHGWTRIPSLYQ
jgi:Arc/MetJ-type ribon-helix-helix transcriptional regulator